MPRPVPHRPAAQRGRTRLRARDGGSGERRRHRPTLALLGAGGCVVRRWRRWYKDAARVTLRPTEPLPRLHGAARAAHPGPPGHGPRSAGRPCGCICRARPRGSVAAVVGQRGPTGGSGLGLRADPGPGQGGTRSRVTWGFDVTPVHAVPCPVGQRSDWPMMAAILPVPRRECTAATAGHRSRPAAWGRVSGPRHPRGGEGMARAASVSGRRHR
jgi:hypothetical protein